MQIFSCTFSRNCFTASLMLLVAGCGGYSLVPPQTTLVASAFNVTPKYAWNKQPDTPGLEHAEIWTQDGPALNRVIYFGGIKDGEAMIKTPSGAEAKAPKFKSSMLPQEVVEFVEKSYRVQTSSPAFTVTSLKPITFSGQPGFSFDFDFTTKDEVRRKGRAAGAIKNGSLYLIIYEGAAVYYFNRNLPEVDQIISSAQLRS